MSLATVSNPSALHKLVRLWQQLWYSASQYFPVVIMALLALGTWWLVRNTPHVQAPQTQRLVKHEADYFMRQFALKNYDAQGQLKSELAGEELRHFVDTDILEITQARIRFARQGRLTIASANKAYSNADGSEVQLVGNARVVRTGESLAPGKSQPDMQFKGEFLHAFMNEERLKSHKPVTITQGPNQFSADSMEYNHLDRVASLQGRVRAVLVPRGGR